MQTTKKHLILSALFISMLWSVPLHAKRMFARGDIINLCESMRMKKSDDLVELMEVLIEKADITKEQWNKYYAFKVYCTGDTPLFYSLRWELEDFQTLADYGVDLNHPIKDYDGKISTVKDYVVYKFKTVPKKERSKWRKISRVIKTKGAKNCAEQPELECTAKYLKESER